MTVPEDIATALRERRAVVATGVTEPLLRTLVEVLSEGDDFHKASDAASDAAGADESAVGVETPWRVALRPEAADAVADEFVLSTRAQGLREAGALDLRVGDANDPAVLSTDAAAFAVAGPAAEPTLLSDEDPSAAVREGALETFDAAAPFDDCGPTRRTLRERAREDLSDSFAAELEDALRGAERLYRGEDANVLTLTLAVGARTDHLFGDVREWGERVGIAAREQFIAPRDALVERGLVETIKTPVERGHPHSRLRAVDERLVDCPPAELVETLAKRFADANDHEDDDAAADRTPVWKR